MKRKRSKTQIAHEQMMLEEQRRRAMLTMDIIFASIPLVVVIGILLIVATKFGIALLLIVLACLTVWILRKPILRSVPIQQLIMWGDNKLESLEALPEELVEMSSDSAPAKIVETIDHEKKLDALRETAMRRVKVNPDESDFILTDVGVLVGDDIFRYDYVPLEVETLRPFAEITFKIQQTASIVIEIADNEGNRLFAEEAQFDKNSRKVLMVTHNHLIVAGHPQKHHWEVRVKVNGNWLAIHQMKWSKVNREVIEAQAKIDGELNQALYQVFQKEDSTHVSLADLLGDETIS